MSVAMFDRVNARAAKAARVSPAKVILSVLLAPLFVLGWLLGALWSAGAFVAVFMWGALVEGFDAGRSKVRPVRPKGE